MIRFGFGAALALALTLLAAPHSAMAQTKKDARCVPNYMETCIKQCSSRGGQPRFCPAYCSKRSRELGC